MTEKAEDKVEALPDLDDLLQCPVCYEIPSGQIFQCNEGHHVCGRCKMRLDVCPVCRAFFFGTRNYAMEELIANIKKLRAFKLGGKVTTDTAPAEAPAQESSTEEEESVNDNANEEDDASSRASSRPPAACKGLFRCLCCKMNPERLPLGRLLNHLRYYHSPDLIEGRSENGSYLQAWQFPTSPGRMVTAVRVHDMGIFYLVIEIARNNSIMSWLSMAAAPWVAQEFAYSLTLSGNDREAIFSDSVWSVRSCEGTLKKRGHCLSVGDGDARAMLAGGALAGKLCVRRAGTAPRAPEPRAVVRRANRSQDARELEPFLLDLQLDVARLSRAFSMLGREASALLRSERAPEPEREPAPAPEPEPSPAPPLSRSARRRMRQRLREAFRENSASDPALPPQVVPPPVAAPRCWPPPVLLAPRPAPPPVALPPRPAPPPQLAAVPRPAPPRFNNGRQRNVIVGTGVFNGGLQAAPRTTPARAAAPAASAAPAPAQPAAQPPAPAPGSSQEQAAGTARNRKKRRQRR